MIMEYCGSQTLQKLVEDKGKSEDLLRELFQQILKGVRFLHQHGVAHRDLKPTNILINSKGVPKIIDLGLCSVSNTAETVYCGTPAYMNPQMAERRGYLATKHDVWCIGVMLFLLVFGKHPFGGSIVSKSEKTSPNYKIWLSQTNIQFPSKPQNISSELRSMIIQCLSKQESDRPTIEQLLSHPWITGTSQR